MISRKLFLKSIFIITILTTSSLAAIVQEQQCANLYADQMPKGEFVDWTADYQFNKFDPSKGRLLGVEFNATLNGSLFAEAENRANLPVTGAYVNVNSNMSVEMIEGEMLNQDVNITSGTYNVAKFDGTLDFLGPSAFNASAEDNTSGSVSPSNVAAYVGPGIFNLTAIVTATSQLVGGGEWALKIDPRAWSYACITYTYDDQDLEEWNLTFGGTADDSSASVQQTSDGGFIIAGQSCSYGNSANNVWLLKTDSVGNELWNNTFSNGASQAGDSVQQAIDGGYIIAGMIQHLDNNAWLIKANSTGTKLWDKEFGGSSGDDFRDIQKTSDGGFVVTGSTYGYNAGGHNAWLIEKDSNGQALEVTFSEDLTAILVSR